MEQIMVDLAHVCERCSFDSERRQFWARIAQETSAVYPKYFVHERCRQQRGLDIPCHVAMRS
eukprot:245780-Amphidinium_carterae.1